MKICFVVPAVYSFFEPKLSNKKVGGAERQVYYLAKELAKDKKTDVNLCVADFGQKNIEKKENITIWKSFDYQENKIVGLWKLYNTLRKIKADIYIFRAADAGVFFGVLIAKFLLRKKTLYMIASDAEINFLDLKEMIGSFSARFMSWIYPLIDTITAQSLYQKDEFKKQRSIDVKTVIKNIYPLTKRIQISEKQSFNLWVGRLIPIKKAELYLDLAQKFPEEEFKMIAPISEGEMVYGQQIQKKASEIPNLELIDFVAPDKIKSYYQQAKIYVTSSHMEGFSNTMMEAMEAEKPILSWNVNPDGILEKYQMGFCAYEDTAKFHVYFKQLSQNLTLSQTMGEAGRKYLEKQHSQKQIIIEFKKVIKSMMS